jgi:hypothetical protein
MTLMPFDSQQAALQQQTLSQHSVSSQRIPQVCRSNWQQRRM